MVYRANKSAVIIGYVMVETLILFLCQFSQQITPGGRETCIVTVRLVEKPSKHSPPVKCSDALPAGINTFSPALTLLCAAN